MWRLKVLIQFVLGHIPYGEHLNHRLQKARGSYSESALLNTLVAQLTHASRLNDRFPLAGLTAVEIGPGWKGLGSIVLSLFGVKHIHAYDHVPHLRLELMLQTIDAGLAHVDVVAEASGLDETYLKEHLASMRVHSNLEALLQAIGVEYHAPADASRTGLPDQSVDLIFSYGVLEHVNPQAIESLTRESRRILKSTGRAFHNIGLHDHYQGYGLDNGVNFLRYPEWLWRLLVDNKIAYHNRLRAPQLEALFSAAGATTLWSDRELLANNMDAVRAMPIAEPFQGLSVEDLAASHLYVDLGWPA